MHRRFKNTMAVTVTAAVGPQMAQQVVMADSLVVDDGHLTLYQGSTVVSVLAGGTWKVIDPKPLQDLTPAAVVIEHGEGQALVEPPPGVKLERGTKLYPWPDPKVAELEQLVESLQTDLRQASRELMRERKPYTVRGGEAGLAEGLKDLAVNRASGPISAKTDHLPTEEEILSQYRKSGAALGQQINNRAVNTAAAYRKPDVDDPQHPDNCGFDGPTGAN